MPLLEFTNKGIYCAQADVYIDPWKKVKRALITHGHADHSRWGHSHYLCTKTAMPVIRHRLGPINIESVEYGESRTVNGVKFSFHPAGHILGSAQIRAEYKGEVWVASGDYKIEDDGLAEAFEPVKCHGFITESTFGMPVYKWQPQAEVFAEINDWWRENNAQGKVSIISAYALGKAQRIMQNVDPGIGRIFTHGAVENINEVMRKQGIPLVETTRVHSTIKKDEYKGGLVIAPPSAVGGNWTRKFQPFSVAIASGWMNLRGARRRRNADRGFVLSDHADWDGLNQAVADTGASKVIVTHGYTEVFTKWLREQGYEAYGEKTQFESETPDDSLA